LTAPGEAHCEGNAVTTPDPPPGRYQHYKGNEYEVLGVARHSETDEELVVYRPLYGAGGLWVRPRAMFCDTVTVGGLMVPRFRYVGPDTGHPLGESRQ
jgi:hypothetical protein